MRVLGPLIPRSFRGALALVVAAGLTLETDRAECEFRVCNRPTGHPLPELPRHAGERPDVSFTEGRDGYARWLEQTRRNREAVAAGELTPEEARALGGLGIFGLREFPVFPFLYANSPGEPHPRATLEQLLFTGPWPTGTMKQYFEEVSYGLFTVGGLVEDWHLLPKHDTYYEGPNHGLQPETDHFGEAMYEILEAHDPFIDFGQFDNDGLDGFPNSGDDDGFVDFAAFVTPENGAECAITTCPFTGNDNIWSHQGYLKNWDGFYYTDDDRTGGGKIRVNRYFVSAGVSCEDAGFPNGIGTFCHEFGHVLGLRDYYDTTRHSEGIGHWGLMASGGWNTPDRPSHLTAWAKEDLGWLHYFNVTQDQTLCLPPVETNPIAARLWTHGAAGPQYFLVENRQRIGFDLNLHAPGLVIYHVDETKTSNDSEPHKRIDVECADAFTADHVVDADHLDLGRCIGGNRGDAGDPWCPATQTTFDANSIPDTRSYAGSPTQVAVRNIGSCGAGPGQEICAQFEVGVALTADLCMRDCAQDGCVEISSCEPWWASPALWIDHDGDGEDDLPSEDMENVLWYRVVNDGPEPIAGAFIEIFTRIPGLGLRWPDAGELLGSETIDEVIQPGFTYVDSIIFVYPPTPENVDHYCLGALIQHDLDPMNSQYPPHDNNLVQVNHQVLVERAEGGLLAGKGPLGGGGSFTKTSRLQIHEGGSYYGRLLEVRLGSPPTFDDWSIPGTWTLQFDAGPFTPPPGAIDSIDVVMSSTNAMHGETAHVPLTLWDLQNDEPAGGVILDYRIDDFPPAPPESLEAECLEVVPDQIVGPWARLEWSKAVVDVDGQPEVTRYYEVYRGDSNGNPETLVGRVAVDADFERAGFQWFDDVRRDSGVVYTYRVRAIDGAGNASDYSSPANLDFLACSGALTRVDDEPSAARFLEPARPNPFTAATTLSFRLPSPRPVRLAIFDARGRRVATLIDGELPAGRHQRVWRGRDATGKAVGPGIYFARLEAGTVVETQKTIVLE